MESKSKEILSKSEGEVHSLSKDDIRQYLEERIPNLSITEIKFDEKDNNVIITANVMKLLKSHLNESHSNSISNTKIGILEEKNCETNNIAKIFEKQIKHLSSQLEIMDSERERLEDKNVKLTDEICSLKKSMFGKCKRVATEDQSVETGDLISEREKKLEMEKLLLQDRVSALTIKIISIEESKNNKENLEKSIETMKERINKLEEENTNYKKEINSLKTQLYEKSEELLKIIKDEYEEEFIKNAKVIAEQNKTIEELKAKALLMVEDVRNKIEIIYEKDNICTELRNECKKLKELNNNKVSNNDKKTNTK